jgi:hypothetical protein
MKYRAVFKGRRINAQGIRYWVQAVAVGESRDLATLNLYDRWEHIEHLELTPVDDDCEFHEGEILEPVFPRM